MSEHYALQPGMPLFDTDISSDIAYRSTGPSVPGKSKNLHDRNQLNNLNGKEWVEFTKSWFIENPPPRRKNLLLHPAKFPESLVRKFLRFFTKDGEENVVLDPFGGTASSMVALDELNVESGGNRRGICIELNPKYAEIARSRTLQTVITADSLSFPYETLPKLDFIISSPPYWNVLHKDTGHVNKKREQAGYDVVYSDNPMDLGNIEDYDRFIKILSDFFASLSSRLKEKRFAVVVLSSTNRKGTFYPIPYDFAREIGKKSDLVWKGEKIWCQDNKALMPYGYPYSFVPNFTHHSCLIFRKN